MVRLEEDWVHQAQPIFEPVKNRVEAILLPNVPKKYKKQEVNPITNIGSNHTSKPKSNMHECSRKYGFGGGLGSSNDLGGTFKPP